MARQFVEISRPRIEGLLSAFPKLLGSSDKRQHTFIETPNVRYVYQPMEELYMLIITNKSSNILEDLDALHLLAKIVSDYCSQLKEENVVEAAFDLIFAFDECFAMGYKEKLTMRQIEENLEMDSHNERMHEVAQRNLQHEAEQQAAEVASRLERERKAGVRPVSQLPSHANANYEAFKPAPAAAPEDSWGNAKERGGGGGGGGGGMKLSAGNKSNKDDAFLQQVAKQDSAVKAGPSAAQAAAAASAAGGAGGKGKAAEKRPVDFDLSEVVTATIDKEGEVSSVAVRGELNVLITDPACAAIRVRLPPADSHFSFHTHPAVDKAAFKGNVLAPRDPIDAPFPLNTKVKVATWKSKGNPTDELTPLTVNCWPSAGNQQTTVVNMEFELQHKNRTLRDVVIRIPSASKTAPVVQKAAGDYKYDARAKVLEWSIPLIDGDSPDGSLEFVIANLPSTSNLFPIEVTFTGDYITCSIDALAVAAPDGSEVRFSKKASITTENYQVVESE